MCYFYLACDAIFRNSVRNDFLQPFDSVRGGSESPSAVDEKPDDKSVPLPPFQDFFSFSWILDISFGYDNM